MKMRKQRTVLAVDDSLMVCEQIKTALKNEDLELHVAPWTAWKSAAQT